MPQGTDKNRLLLGLVLFAVTFLAYIPALRSGFVWDDNIILTDNPLIKAPDGLLSFWFSTLPPDYFPLASTMLWFEWRLFGMDHPWGYHAVTIFLHACSSFILWRLLRRLQVPGALLAAFLFALHPVNVEAVAWIAQRKSTLSEVFGLLAALLFFKSAAAAGPKRDFWRAPGYRAALLCFTLGLLAKTSVAMLPAAFLVLAWWRSGSLKRDDILRTLPFFAVAGILSMVTIWFQYNISIGDDVVRDDGFLSRLAISGWAIWFYIYKALLPVGLIFVYPRWQADVANPLAWLPLLLVALSFFALWRHRARPWVRATLVAFAVYVIMLFPVLGFFDIYFMRYSYVADHWQYPAIPAILGLLAALLATLSKRLPGKNLAPAIAILPLAIYSALTWNLASDYRDEETLWRATLAKNSVAGPAHENLGIVLSREGRVEEAIHHFRINLLLRPTRAAAYNNLAAALNHPDQVEEARFLFQKGLELDPTISLSWYNLGNLLYNEGREEEAIAHYRKAIELNPNYANAHANLGNALLLSGRTKEAIAHLRKSLESRPELLEARFSLANALLKEGETAKALAQFEVILKLQPNQLDTLNRLTWILATHPDPSVRNAPRALDRATEANRLSGGSAATLRTLAAAQAESGRFQDAATTARRAIDLAIAAERPDLAKRIRIELELYRKGSPLRDDPAAPAP